MIQRSEIGAQPLPVRVYGFLVGVEVEDGVDLNKIALRLADSLTFVEGLGQVTVDALGEVEIIEEGEQPVGEWIPPVPGDKN